MSLHINDPLIDAVIPYGKRPPEQWRTCIDCCVDTETLLEKQFGHISELLSLRRRSSKPAP